MGRIHIVREDPKPTPITGITIHLTLQEAKDLVRQLRLYLPAVDFPSLGGLSLVRRFFGALSKAVIDGGARSI